MEDSRAPDHPPARDAGLDDNAAQAAAKMVQEQFASGTAGAAVVFGPLGVKILAGEGKVYARGGDRWELASHLLGPLAGAQAMVTDGSQATPTCQPVR